MEKSADRLEPFKKATGARAVVGKLLRGNRRSSKLGNAGKRKPSSSREATHR